MKKAKIILALAACLMLLTSCAKEQEKFPVATAIPTQNTRGLAQSEPAPTATEEAAQNPTGAVNYDDGKYNPAMEEGSGAGEVIDIPMVTPAPTVCGEYAGATPVAIDPIDKPTPTPMPSLKLADAVTYDATRLHMSFSAPGGWVVDDADANTYIITYPNTAMAYQANVTIRRQAVSSNYTTSMLTSEVNTMISNIKTKIGFKSFSTMKVGDRTLMEKAGKYNDFYGTTNDGVEIYGRVHVTCIEKTLYSITIICPRGYWENYKTNVYNKIRSTLMITR